MHTLSQLYQGLQPSYPAPSFRKHIFASPDTDILQRFGPMMPHLTGTFPVPEIYQRYAERNQSTRRIDWYVTQGQASLIRDHANGFSSIPLSVQDCLTSYIVSTFNRCGYHTLSTVTNAASVCSWTLLNFALIFTSTEMSRPRLLTQMLLEIVYTWYAVP